MPGYRQNQPNVVNRAPDSQRPGARLPAYPVYSPAMVLQDSETPTRWTPFGTFVPALSSITPGGGRASAAQRHDGLDGRLMDVPQADTYNAAPNPFPANGVADDPMMYTAIARLIRLRPTTSAHPGASLTSGEASPAMVFHAPPVFGLQTRPIVAVGL